MDVGASEISENVNEDSIGVIGIQKNSSDEQGIIDEGLLLSGVGVENPEDNLTSHTKELIGKTIMDTDDSREGDAEITFSLIKNPSQKDDESIKNGAALNVNDQTIDDDDIEKLLSKTLENSVQDSKVLSTAMVKSEQPAGEFFSANPEKASQEDMKAALSDTKELDVLVCGNCHLTFNFIEEFTKHKNECSRKSPFHGGMIEQKPAIWAFLLYKNALVKQNPQKFSGDITESSWKLYQKWCKMSDHMREAWVAAGESIMNYMSYGKPGKGKSLSSTLKRLDPSTSDSDDSKRPVIMKKFCQRDQSGGIMNIRPGGLISSTNLRTSISEDNESVKHQLEDESSLDALPGSKNKKDDELREEEFVVERIVSRRFNPRRKQYEYLLKWEGYPPEQNTWEPAENLEACQHLLKAFEESLNKQALKKNLSLRKPDYNSPSSSGNSINTFGRPVRSSKQKALSQVKQWCGSIKPDEAEIETMMKRKMSPMDSDDDDDNFVGKRLRLGSDSEDSVGGRPMNKGGIVRKTSNAATPHRGPGRPRKYPLPNGTASRTPVSAATSLGIESSDEGENKTTLEILSQANVTKALNLSPANQQVLVANAKGVVKVDPSQVPNLSSGVYIMSNKSGIIKLDSVSPSKALSMKQGIVKDISPTLKPIESSIVQKSSMISSRAQPSNTSELLQKSGIVRKSQPSTGSASILPGAKAPAKLPKPSTGSIKINSPNPNTRFLHSGLSRPNISIAPSNKPKPIIRTVESQKKVLEVDPRSLPSQNKYGKGGNILAGIQRTVARGGSTPLRSGITKVTTTTTTANSGSVDDPEKPVGTVCYLTDFVQQGSPSSDSESGLPDDFPTDLPPLAPASPPRPLTLCPETGKVLMKTEDIKTPDLAPLSVSSAAPTITTESSFVQPVVIKEEFVEKPLPPLVSTLEPTQLQSQITTLPQHQQLLKSMKSKKDQDVPSPAKPKESLVKRTLGRPGSIGSMSVSPKKIFSEIEDESDVVTITGDDGMIYKVSKTELSNSLLMAGEEGQQCVYLTTGENGDENAAVITLDPSSYPEQVNQLGQVSVLGEVGEEEANQYYVKEGTEGDLMDIQVQGQDGADDNQSQLVAQLVEAGEPAPGGGPRRVVLLLPDGNLMMTEVDEEQYAALELDKFQGQTAETE